MREMIETIVNILIAFIGIIIAALQFRIERIEYRRERERENETQKKKQVMKRISSQTESVGVLVELTDKVNKLSRLPFSPEINGEWFSMVQEVCLEYDKCKSCIESLYAELLTNESEFSLSYGYGRYIDAFREYLLLDVDVEIMGKNILLMDHLSKQYAELQSKGEKVNSEAYFNARNEIKATVSKLNLLLRNIVLLINEIKIKYSNI